MKKIILTLTAFCIVCMSGCGAVEKTINKVYDGIKGGVDKPIVKSYAGYNNDAFIDEDGNLYISGDNAGDGTDKNQSIPVKVMENVKDVSIGDHYTAVVTNDGELYTWGINDFGRLGQGKNVDRSDLPVKILDNVNSVYCAKYTAMAVTKDGELYKWGNRGGYDSTYYSPVKIMENVKSAVLDDEKSAVITYDDELYIWNTEGVVEMIKDDPHILKVLDDVKMVDVEHEMYIAVTKDGSLYTWGTGGDTATPYGYEPEEEPDPYSAFSYNTPKKIMDNVKYAKTNGSNALAITKNDDLYVWGCNTHGLIGNGTVTWKNVYTPYKVMEDVEYAFINGITLSKCGSNILAIKKDGSLYAWGDNTGNIFGDIEKEYEDDPEMPKLTKILMPKPKKIMDNVDSVSMYASHMYAVTKDKEAYRLPPTNIKNHISDENKEKIKFAE